MRYRVELTLPGSGWHDDFVNGWILECWSSVTSSSISFFKARLQREEFETNVVVAAPRRFLIRPNVAASAPHRRCFSPLKNKRWRTIYTRYSRIVLIKSPTKLQVIMSSSRAPEARADCDMWSVKKSGREMAFAVNGPNNFSQHY